MTITGGTALSKDEIDRIYQGRRVVRGGGPRAGGRRGPQPGRPAHLPGGVVPQGERRQLADADKAELTAKNDELQQALKDESTDAGTPCAASDALMRIWQRAGQTLHQQAAQEQQAAPADGGAGDLYAVRRGWGRGRGGREIVDEGGGA